MEQNLQTNRTLTDEAYEVGRKRAQILKLARPLLAQTGKDRLPVAEIARIAGTSPGNLCKLAARFENLKDEELTPERLAGKFTNSGRRSTWEEIAAKPEVQERIKQLYLVTTGASSDYMTVDRRTGSMAMALEQFAYDPLCPEHLQRDLISGKQPMPLKRLIRSITPGMEQRNRGNKHMSLHGTFRSSREMVEYLATGERYEITGGDWWVFDDMSSNLPHWFNGPDGEPMVGRQGLYAYDITGKWLGLEKVGTARDSYTAAIILRFVRRLMLTIGKPRRGIVFEQSVWKSRVIRGVRVTTTGAVVEDDYDRPAMSEEDKALIQDGLEALGIKIFYTHTPRGKEIESAFNFLQRLLPVVAHQEIFLKTGRKVINIGRHRGEFEDGAKALRRAHAGSHHPQALGFLSIDDAADLEERTMERIDLRIRKRKRKRQTEPTNVIYQRSLAAKPLEDLNQRDLAVFLPKAHELEIRGGKVVATVDGDPYEFSDGDMFARLGSGYRIYLRFDPSEPTLGAAIYNREKSSANHHGWQDGQFITWADFILPVGRFDWRDQKDGSSSNTQKRRHDKFVRTAFRAIGMPKASAATARDGEGNVREITKSRAGELPQRSSGPQRVKKRAGIPIPTEAEVVARRKKQLRSASIVQSILNQK